jgi:hypothetical protein
MTRPIYEIAEEIKRCWPKVYFGAVPYLEAMYALDKPTDMYGADSANSVVSYFLANANGFKGEDARRLKSELKHMFQIK